MITFLGTTSATRPPTGGRISLSRDLIRDWRRWSRAERVTALSILAVLLAEMSLGLAVGIRSFT
jgi:predicted alpha/beta hydrolase